MMLGSSFDDVITVLPGAGTATAMGLTIFSAALCLSIALYAIYNAFLSPLRHYPGPFLWRAFRFPYVISVHRGEIHRRLKQFHEKYGPVVRIAPNELSYASSAAWKDIYATRPGHAPFPRNPTWFKKLDPGEPESIMGPDEEAHGRFRRAFANSFSDKSLRDQSPVIEKYVNEWMAQLTKLSTNRQGKKKPVDLMQWLNFLTFDISGDLTFGESFDCVKNGKAHYWVEITQTFGKGLAVIASINQYSPLDKLLRFVIPKNMMQRQIDFRHMSAAKARQRLALEADRPDFISPTKKYNEQKSAISAAEWEINMAILIFAGSETLASTMSAIMRELVQHRGVLNRLTQEIRDAFEVESDITIATTGKLTYLNAVINEGMRLDPAVVVGVPRVVPPGGDIICNNWVPGGTYVAVNQFPLNRLAANFRHPNSFIPERFINPDPDTDDMSTFNPFSLGRQSCIGMKLAYAEMRLVLSRLLFTFDVKLADEKDRWDWGEQETYILWEKRPLQVFLRQRQTVPFQ